MLSKYAAASTAVVLFAIILVDSYLAHDSAFVQNAGCHGLPREACATNGQQAVGSILSQPTATMRSALGVNGLVAFGMGFGMLAAAVTRTKKTALNALYETGTGIIEVKEDEKAELATMAYLDNVPKALMDTETLDLLLSVTPKEQWEDPAEGTPLYALKLYAETYGEGPGKSSKMGWFDYWTMMIINNELEDQTVVAANAEAAWKEQTQLWRTGVVPLYVPTNNSVAFTGAFIKWRGAEPFAGDQVQTPVTDGLFARQFLKSMAFYRDGLKPWQRGIEIGMAHGYFLIGPFTSLGPLRNTPEAATVGLLCGAAVVGIVSVGGLIFGTTIKPTLFDKPGDKPAAGFQEMINWHAVGGLGGAGFAHALITIFGS
jgi:photosystem I subunit 11